MYFHIIIIIILSFPSQLLQNSSTMAFAAATFAAQVFHYSSFLLKHPGGWENQEFSIEGGTSRIAE